MRIYIVVEEIWLIIAQRTIEWNHFLQALDIIVLLGPDKGFIVVDAQDMLNLYVWLTIGQSAGNVQRLQMLRLGKNTYAVVRGTGLFQEYFLNG